MVIIAVQMDVTGTFIPSGPKRVADTRFRVSGASPSKPPEMLALLLEEDGEGPEHLRRDPMASQAWGWPWEAHPSCPTSLGARPPWLS